MDSFTTHFVYGTREEKFFFTPQFAYPQTEIDEIYQLMGRKDVMRYYGNERCISSAGAAEWIHENIRRCNSALLEGKERNDKFIKLSWRIEWTKDVYSCQNARFIGLAGIILYVRGGSKIVEPYTCLLKDFPGERLGTKVWACLISQAVNSKFLKSILQDRQCFLEVHPHNSACIGLIESLGKNLMERENQVYDVKRHSNIVKRVYYRMIKPSCIISSLILRYFPVENAKGRERTGRKILAQALGESQIVCQILDRRHVPGEIHLPYNTFTKMVENYFEKNKFMLVDNEEYVPPKRNIPVTFPDMILGPDECFLLLIQRSCDTENVPFTIQLSQLMPFHFGVSGIHTRPPTTYILLQPKSGKKYFIRVKEEVDFPLRLVILCINLESMNEKPDGFVLKWMISNRFLSKRSRVLKRKRSDLSFASALELNAYQILKNMEEDLNLIDVPTEVLFEDLPR